MDKLHFASAEANSLSKQAEYRRQVEQRKQTLAILGKSQVRLSDLDNGKYHIVHCSFSIKNHKAFQETDK